MVAVGKPEAIVGNAMVQLPSSFWSKCYSVVWNGSDFAERAKARLDPFHVGPLAQMVRAADS